MEKFDLLNSTGVSLKDPRYQDLLATLQGNILKGHGRTHAYHLFLTIKPGAVSIARTWIAQFAGTVTTAFKQLKDAEERETNPEKDGGKFFSFLLSAKGYEILGIPVPGIPSDKAFLAGLKNRTGITKDEITNWENSFKNEIHVLLIVADQNISTVTREKDNIIAQVTPFADVVFVQKGKILRNHSGVGIEHFGYADGISQPNFLKTDDSPATQWEDNGALLNTVLVREPGEGESSYFGSYFVFRKLEQNVKKFKDYENALSQEFNQEPGDIYGIFNKHRHQNKELAGAMIIGRFEDGTEVINHSDEKDIEDESQMNNDFDYRDDAIGSITNGSKCPFHAHIRIANPRADIGETAKQIRLTRRGMPFNDIGRDESDLEKDQPDGGVGLLFMCFQSSITGQFEKIQGGYANTGIIGNRNVGQDAVIGQGANAIEKSLPVQWGINAQTRLVPSTFRDFVTMRGGEYFFAPSIPFLKNLYSSSF